jgi:RHS repeat-associated protein
LPIALSDLRGWEWDDNTDCWWEPKSTISPTGAIGGWFSGYRGQQVWDEAIAPEVDKATAESKSANELQQRLESIVGGQTGIVYEIAKNRPDLVPYLPNADQLLQNVPSPNAPAPVPADRVDGSSTQGLGPLPSSPLLDPASQGKILDASSPDSGGQGAASSPASGRIGGDPLVLFSGQLYHQVTDLAVRGRGLHFAFTRTYLSRTIYRGPLGYSWDHSYNLWLREERIVDSTGAARNAVARSTGTLREDRYLEIVSEPVGDLPPLNGVADATFEAPLGYFDRLEKSGGTYVVVTVAGLRFEYNESLYVSRIVDRNGNTMLFDYTGGLLTLVRDPVGKEFAFEYDEQKRITLLHDLTGDRRVYYSYDSLGNLDEVDFGFEPDLVSATDYRYASADAPQALHHSLTEIVSGRGHSVLLCMYGTAPGTPEFGRVIEQRSADGGYLYEYGQLTDSNVDPAVDPDNVPLTYTRVQYPNDHCVEHWFNWQGNVVRRAEQVIGTSAGLVELTASYRYNADGLLIEEIRPEGDSVEYRYESDVYAASHGGEVTGASSAERLRFGNLVKRIEKPRSGSNETRMIVTEYAWQAATNQLASQRGPFYSTPLLEPLSGQTIGEVTYEYDDAGNLTQITYPETQLPDGTPQTPDPAVFSYDAHGSVTEASAGQLRTKYEYFPDTPRSGFLARKIADPDGAALATAYGVDQLGRVTRVVEPYGATTDITYTTFDAQKVVTLPAVAGGARATVSYQYDLDRLLTEVTEQLILPDGSPHPDGALVQRFVHDEYGRLVEQRLGPAARPEERRRLTVMNACGLSERELDFNGNATVYSYDERLLTASLTRGWGTPARTERTFRYNPSGELIRAIDGLGHTTEVDRDGFGRPYLRKDPDGTDVETEYDAAGRVTKVRIHGLHPETGLKVRWSEKEYRFDTVGRLAEEVAHLFVPGEPSPAQLLRTSYYHDTTNRVVKCVNADGSEWHFDYDALNRLAASRSPSNDETIWNYDDPSRSLIVSRVCVGEDDAGAAITEVFEQLVRFDERSLPVEKTDGLLNVTQVRFDSRRLATTVIDPNGHQYHTDYSVYGDAVAFRSKLATKDILTSLQYDANRNLIALLSPSGGTTVWNYDVLNRVSAIETGSGRSTYEYDAEDRLTIALDANGIAIHRIHTPTGLVAAETPDLTGFTAPPEAATYAPTPTSARTYTYTPAGSIAVAEYGASKVTLDYDSLGHVITEHEGSHHVRYDYDPLGRLTKLIFPDGREIRYDYTPDGSLAAIFQVSAGTNYPGNPLASFNRPLVESWTIGRRPIVMRFDSSLRAFLRVDSERRRIGADWTQLPGGEPILSERNLFGSIGEWRVQQIDDELRLLSYDDVGRLVTTNDYTDIELLDISQLTPPTTAQALPPSSDQSAINEVIAATEGKLNGIEAIRHFSYTLDPNANRLTLEENVGLGDVVTTYVTGADDEYQLVGTTPLKYDRAGNLIDDGTNKYRYDAFGRFTGSETPAGSIDITHDGLGRPASIQTANASQDLVHAGSRLIEWREAGAVVGQLVPLDRPHAYAQLATAGMDCVPIADVVGSVVAYVQGDTGPIGRSTYDPFGVVLSRGPAWPAPIGFAGYRQLDPAGLYDLAARPYDPRIGRFLQRDPLGFVDGTNLYAFAHHAPGSLVDYWGHASHDIDFGTAAWSAAKTVAIGGAVIAGAAGLVTAGIVSAPFVAVIGGLALAGSGMMSFFRRSEEAFKAGQTDPGGAAALAALGDTVGLTNIYEGATGRDAVTDRALGSVERGDRLGTGVGSVATALFGSRFARFGGGIGGRLNPATVPSVSRPSLYNPVVFGGYRMPILQKNPVLITEIAGNSGGSGTPTPLAAKAAGTDAAPVFEARAEAQRIAAKLVSQELAEGHITPARVATRFGTVLDAIGKAHVRQSIADGRLPSTYVTSPTVGISRGFPRAWYRATDVWDTATGRSWDFMTPREAYFYEHEGKYLGQTMPDGTVITEVNPLFYTR